MRRYATPAHFPIVLYSPGGDLHRRDNTDKAEELASHGYIVVGIDAPETPLSVFPEIGRASCRERV